MFCPDPFSLGRQQSVCATDASQLSLLFALGARLFRTSLDSPTAGSVWPQLLCLCVGGVAQSWDTGLWDETFPGT